MKQFFGLLILLNCTSWVIGQQIERQVISCGGGFLIQPDWSLSFTVGEPAISILEKDELVLFQGFQQGSLSLATGIAQYAPFLFSISPNPFQNQLRIDWEEQERTNISINIFDVLGRLVFSQTRPPQSGAISLELEALPNGHYFIVLENDFKKKGVLSIVKQ